MVITFKEHASNTFRGKILFIPFFDLIDTLTNKIINGGTVDLFDVLNIKDTIDKLLTTVKEYNNALEYLVLIRIFYNNYIGLNYQDINESKKTAFNDLVKTIQVYTHEKIAKRCQESSTDYSPS